MRLTRRHYDLLGRAFDAEMSARLPMQTTSAAALSALYEGGLLAPMERRCGIVTVRGWRLTHAGMLEYCTWADKQGVVVKG